MTCRDVIERFGGGVWKGRKAKAVVPGGLSTGLLTADELDTPLDFNGPVRAGCLGLGTAGVVVLDETYSMIDFLHNSCRFFAHESCGQCTPCREGTHWALSMLERIKAGRGRLKDLDLLLEIADSIGILPGTTICGAGRRGRLADQERHPQIPQRVRRVHPPHQSAGLCRHGPGSRDRRAEHRTVGDEQ